MLVGLIFALTAGVVAGQRLPTSVLALVAGAVIGAALSLPVGMFAAYVLLRRMPREAIDPIVLEASEMWPAVDESGFAVWRRDRASTAVIDQPSRLAPMPNTGRTMSAATVAGEAGQVNQWQT